MLFLVAGLVLMGVRALRLAVMLPLMSARLAHHVVRTTAASWTLATQDTLICPGCDNDVSLVGRWQCGRCRYVFDGFAFARCAICAAVPAYLPCRHCGSSLRNPIRQQPLQVR